ncbi:hypothetical protein R1flu_027998 [Riccia fluitans]|uniref:Uncharacterized protein n=1 Tax=Riccia fluitans TaxID=41844 RepID=A0ABD1XKF2_9MARC
MVPSQPAPYGPVSVRAGAQRGRLGVHLAAANRRPVGRAGRRVGGRQPPPSGWPPGGRRVPCGWPLP